MSVFALAFASVLLKGDIPLEQRLEKLAPHFSPRPGETLTLDETELRDLSKKVKPAKLRGFITVSPPKGTCFTIMRDSSEPDELVCSKKKLSFNYAQLNPNGDLTWQVSTGEGDFGTRLSWHSPYRVAIVTPFDKRLEDPPEYRYIKHCDGLNDPEKGRRIVLTMVNGESWVIRFPAADELLVQPDPIPNLYTSSTIAGQKVSVSEAAANPKEQATKPDAEGAAPAAPAPAAPEARPRDEDDRVEWAIPRRGGYTMNASNFQPHGSVAPGMKGECRYNYQGPVDDPNTGRIECHDVDGFKQVYIPLTCLGQIRTTR